MGRLTGFRIKENTRGEIVASGEDDESGNKCTMKFAQAERGGNWRVVGRKGDSSVCKEVILRAKREFRR